MAAKSSVDAGLGVQPPYLMQDLIVGFIAFACLVYLVVAVLYPEKF